MSDAAAGLKPTCDSADSSQRSRNGAKGAEGTLQKYQPLLFSHARRHGELSRDLPHAPFPTLSIFFKTQSLISILPSFFSLFVRFLLFFMRFWHFSRAWAALARASNRVAVIINISRRRIRFALCTRVWGAWACRVTSSICTHRLVARQISKR